MKGKGNKNQVKNEFIDMMIWIFVIAGLVFAGFWFFDEGFGDKNDEDYYCIDNCVQDTYDCLFSYTNPYQNGALGYVDYDYAELCVDELDYCINDCKR